METINNLVSSIKNLDLCMSGYNYLFYEKLTENTCSMFKFNRGDVEILAQLTKFIVSKRMFLDNINEKFITENDLTESIIELKGKRENNNFFNELYT